MSDQKPEKPVTESAIADRYNFNSGVCPFGRAPWDAPSEEGMTYPLGPGDLGHGMTEALEAFFMGLRDLQDLASFDVGERTEANGQPPAPDYSGITRKLCL